MHDFEFLFCFLQKRKKGTNHSEFLLCFLQINEKGMHHLEFLSCFLQKKEKGMHQSEFLLCFLQKGTRVSEFCFSFCSGRKKEICHASLIFHFLVGQSTMKSAEILFLEN